jgi:5,10-methylene-tetrahydrofolate dehydrogenase/methenyl tetrahydrofolate cyclohydrolase
MGARVIDGRGLAAELKEGLAAEVAGLRDAGIVPGLAAVLVGSPAEAEVKNTADAARISTRAEAARRSLETANAGGIVGTGTISIVSARGERIIR